MSQSKEIVSSHKAPTLPGVPYSSAVKANRFVFTAGQLPDDARADIKTQTRQVLEKIKSLVEAAGSSLDNVVKCTVFITSFEDFAGMNEIYAQYFRDKPPARTTVEVSKLAKESKVEIDAIAALP